MPDSSAQAKPSRRGFVLGATAAGAAAAAVATLPRLQPAIDPVPVAEPEPAPERGGGYRLSAHVQQYYKTTRI